MPMETRSSKAFFQIYGFQKTAEKKIVPPLWGKKREKCLSFEFFSPQPLQAAQFVVIWLQIVKTVIETSLCDAGRPIST